MLFIDRREGWCEEKKDNKEINKEIIVKNEK
jgi:hypothetical protein